MDLSGLIFIALAIAWACYLIPMVLRHTDDLARTRTVEHFSPRLRVFGRQRSSAPPQVEEVRDPVVEPAGTTASAPTRVVMSGGAASRRAAARRRRVLYVLLGILAVTAGVAGLGYLPWWSLAIPAVLVVAFLFIARFTVRRERAGRTIEVIRPDSPAAEPAAPVAGAASPVVEPVETSDTEDTEDTAGLSREALREAEALHEDPLPDDGSLWDPVPVTLPTYVTKPQARRTVRTIELTASSGHDAADSRLARDAEAARAAKSPQPASEAEAAKRRVAGA